MRQIVCMIASLLAVGSSVALCSPDGKGRLNSLDQDYLKATAQSNLEEVQLEPVVRSHATIAQDRQFGMRMKQDHARANAELKRVAAQTGYKLPQDVSEDQKLIMKRLAQFQGARFTAAYRLEMIHDHTEDIARTERELSLGSSTIVLASAQKNLTLLQMQLKMSQALPGGQETSSGM